MNSPLDRISLENRPGFVRGFGPRLTAVGLLIGLLISAGSVTCRGQESSEETEIKLESGPLQKARIELNDIFKLRWDGDQLQIDQDHWIAASKTKAADPYARMFDRGNYPKSARYVNSLFHAAASKLGARNSGMSSSGGQMTRRMQAADSSATLTVTSKTCAIEFVETDGPGRTLALRFNENGQISILVLGGKQLLVIDQSVDGRITVVINAGNGPKSIAGKSFRDLVRSDGELLANELNLVMQHFGISKPMLPHDSIVKKSVRARLELLHGMDASKSFNQLMEQFQSGDFETREMASATINEKYDLYLSLINQKLKQPDLSPEARMRLTKIVKQNARANQISDVIRGFELLDSPEYLIRLGLESLGQDGADSESVIHIAARLRDITGKDFGNDLQAWQRWIQQQKPSNQ